MPLSPPFAILAGAILCATIAIVGASQKDDAFAASLEVAAEQAIAANQGSGISARFTDRFGQPSRHPLLVGGEDMSEETRDRVAKAVAALPGVGGVSWSDGTVMAEAGLTFSPLHCQEDVEGLLDARSIRFEESSSDILPASSGLLDEVAQALRPCLGSTIAVIGHTDSSGPEEINLSLSLDRARSVKQALIARGIPAGGLREIGKGSEEPVDGLSPGDPANRRIEFDVIATVAIEPTPIDTPGPR